MRLPDPIIVRKIIYHKPLNEEERNDKDIERNEILLFNLYRVYLCMALFSFLLFAQAEGHSFICFFNFFLSIIFQFYRLLLFIDHRLKCWKNEANQKV